MWLRMKVVALALLLPACFDMEQRDPGSETEVLLADFEGNSTHGPYPFERWEPFFFNPDGKAINADGKTREDTQMWEFSAGRPPAGTAMMVEVDLMPQSNGDHTGGGIGSFALSSTRDLRGHRVLQVYAKSEIVGALVEPAKLYAQLGCVSAPRRNTQSTAELMVVSSFALDPEWRRFDLKLSDFHVPSWDIPDSVDEDVCLAMVDSVRFVVSADVGLEEAATGRLYVDEVWLR